MKPDDIFAVILMVLVITGAILVVSRVVIDLFPKFSNPFKRNKIEIVTIEGIPGYYVKWDNRIYFDTQLLSYVDPKNREEVERLKKHNTSATKAKEIAEFLINHYYPKPAPKPKKVSKKEFKEALLEDLIDK